MSDEWVQVARKDCDNASFAFKIFQSKKNLRFIFEISVNGSLIADGSLSQSEAESWLK